MRFFIVPEINWHPPHDPIGIHDDRNPWTKAAFDKEHNMTYRIDWKRSFATAAQEAAVKLYHGLSWYHYLGFLIFFTGVLCSSF